MDDPQHLKHYGVLGMRWGRRKAAPAPQSSSVKRSSDARLDERRERRERRRAEAQAKAERGRKIAKIIMTAYAVLTIHQIVTMMIPARKKRPGKVEDFIKSAAAAARARRAVNEARAAAEYTKKYKDAVDSYFV